MNIFQIFSKILSVVQLRSASPRQPCVATATYLKHPKTIGDQLSTFGNPFEIQIWNIPKQLDTFGQGPFPPTDCPLCHNAQCILLECTLICANLCYWSVPCFKQKYFHRRSDQNLKTFTAVLGNKCTAFEPFAEQAPSDLLLSMLTFHTPRGVLGHDAHLIQNR